VLRRISARWKVCEIGVKNHGAIEFDFHSRSVDRDLFEIPLANGAQITSVSGKEAIRRTVVLIRLKRAVSLRSVVKDLQLTEAVVGSITRPRIADCKAVVATWRKLKLNANLKV
jgi:hypothetical protein